MHTSLMELLKHALLDLRASWVMWILLALSAVDLIIIVERALFFRAIHDDLPALAAALDKLLRAGRVREALERMKESRSPEAAVVVAGLRHADGGPASAEKAMLGATALERLRLERGLAILGTVGNNAPFLGLLGTVIGVIEAFEIWDGRWRRRRARRRRWLRRRSCRRSRRRWWPPRWASSSPSRRSPPTTISSG